MSDQSIAKELLLIALGTAKNKAAARAAISMLFPQSKDILGAEHIDTGETSGATRSRKIRTAEHARLYFRLTPDTDVWSKTQIKELLQAEPNAAFDAFVSRLDASPVGEKPKIRRLFLELLEEALTNAEGSERWLIAIADNATALLGTEDWKSAALFGNSNEDMIRIMLSQFLNSLAVDARVEVLGQAINEAKDISLLCEIMRSITGDNEPNGAEYRPEGLGKETSRLREALLARVKQLAADGSLHLQAQPRDILWFWWGTGNGDEVRTYTRQLMTSVEGVSFLLNLPISTVISSAGNYEKVDRKSWNKIVDLPELEKLASNLSSAGDGDEKAKADRFLQAVARDRNDPF